MKIYARLLFGGLSFLLFSSCGGGCLAIFLPFGLSVEVEGKGSIESSVTVVVGSKLVLGVPGSYHIIGNKNWLTGCQAETKTSRVTFYSGEIPIGSTEIAPFRMQWTIVAGKDGVPASGSGEIFLSAQDRTLFRTPPLKIIVVPQ